MAPPPSPPPPQPPHQDAALTTDASDLIKNHLQLARQIKTSAAGLDASQIAAAAQDSTVWPNLVQASLTTLLTQKTLFDLAVPVIAPELAVVLEPLRAANETALKGVRAIQDADKKSRKARRRENKNAQHQNGQASQVPAMTPNLPISERKMKKMKKSQANTETNAVNSETHAQATSIPTVIPSIERPAAATTPVASKPKTKAKPGPKPTPKPTPTAAQIEHNKSRGIGQAEALALLADHFASTPTRKSPTPKRKSPHKDSDQQGMATEAVKSFEKEPDEHDLDVGPVQKKKRKSLHEASGEEKVTFTVSAKDKRKSDVSMKDASAVSTPELKSRTKKLSFADKFHPYKRTPGKKTAGTATDDKTEHHEASEANEPEPHVQEFEDVREDITAEVDEAMQQHQSRLDHEKKAKELGINPAKKHSRKSFEMAGASVDTKQESGTSSAKKRKTHKSKHEGPKTENVKFRGLVGLLERKRKSASPNAVDLALAKGATETKAKKEKKEKKAAKTATEHGWKGGDRDGEGDVVMSD